MINGWARLALGTAGAILLKLSFPHPGLSWLAWIALVPWFIACRGLSPARAFGFGLLFGALACLGIFSWMIEAPVLGWARGSSVILYMALYPALWCLGLALLDRTSIPSALSAAVLWTALDYLRAHAGFVAYPWATLAHGQAGNLPLIQAAAWTGEYGVTFLVVLVNGAVAGLLAGRAWRPLFAAASVAAAVHLWGAWVLARPIAGPSLRVAVVQPDIRVGARDTREGWEKAFRTLERLTLEEAARFAPDLVVWPENAVRDLGKDIDGRERLWALAATVGAPILTGAADFAKRTRRVAGKPGEARLETITHNAAYLVRPDGVIDGPYRKRILVPFSEYVPLEGRFPWPRWMATNTYRTIPGEGMLSFELDGGAVVGPLICWENLFGGYARDMARRGANLLAHLANNSWFDRLATSRQHNAASVLRAAELGVPVAVASNNGPSLVIDGRGRVAAAVPLIMAEGAAGAEVAVGGGGTFYARHGDVFAGGVILSAMAFLAAAVQGRQRNRLVSTGREET